MNWRAPNRSVWRREVFGITVWDILDFTVPMREEIERFMEEQANKVRILASPPAGSKG